MVVGDYVPADQDEDIMFVRDGTSMLNKGILVKYYNKLAKMNEQKCGLYPL